MWVLIMVKSYMTIAIPRVSAFRHLDHLIFLPPPSFPFHTLLIVVTPPLAPCTLFGGCLVCCVFGRDYILVGRLAAKICEHGKGQRLWPANTRNVWRGGAEGWLLNAALSKESVLFSMWKLFLQTVLGETFDMHAGACGTEKTTFIPDFSFLAMSGVAV